MNSLQNRIRIFIAFLLIMVIILFFQFGIKNDQDSPTRISNESRSIDFFIKDSVITRWSAEGEKISVTIAKYAKHFDARKLMELDHPYSLGFYSDGTIAHTLNANTAIYPDDNSRIDLAGSVALHHNPETEQDTTLLTEQLSYFPDRGLATSDQQVEFRSRSGQTNAQGMEFYTRENRLELLSTVRGTYVQSNQN